MRATTSMLGLVLCVGCASSHVTVREAFPPAEVASPWVLKDDVWSGSFAEAATALGDDAETWARFGPTRVWLAVYCHADHPERCLKVRCLAFGSTEDAGAAYAAFRPAVAKPFNAGDVGCWTEVGVLYRWGRLVFDIFGESATWESQVQTTYLATLIGKRMPPGAPENPQ